jgi:predicted enzyme related to lactoylglutathione lyase
MSRVVHFEILASDPERSAAFYREVFGWSSSSWSGPQRYWTLTTGPEGTPGINGALMHKHFPQPVVNTIQVASVEAALARVEQAGGRKLHGPNQIPNVGTVAYCSDIDGTIFGIIEPDGDG